MSPRTKLLVVKAHDRNDFGTMGHREWAEATSVMQGTRSRMRRDFKTLAYRQHLRNLVFRRAVKLQMPVQK
jgi:hypothetical protein